MSNIKFIDILNVNAYLYNTTIGIKLHDHKIYNNYAYLIYEIDTSYFNFNSQNEIKTIFKQRIITHNKLKYIKMKIISKQYTSAIIKILLTR